MGFRRFCLAIWLVATPAFSETRALLVGVSHYDESIGLTSLRGPANDVTLLREVLVARGVDDVVVLADGIGASTLPTHAAILSAMADLARKSGPGDLAIITLSGHGTRQVDDNGDETDGLDEVFLPADVRRAEPGARGIPNALVDDEIGAAVLAIRQTGADVWLVMDSCHSGSGLRGGEADVAARWVDPAVLGISAGAESAEGSGLVDQAATEEPPGQVVAFYAARSSEVAREVNLTPDQPGEAGWYGLFTSRLAARLQAGGALSYRRLFQAVLADMNDSSVPGGARMQTPSWEGGLIDAAVLGGRSTSNLRQYAVTGDVVAAGLVQGMGNGTLLALVDDAAAATDAVLGYAQMEESEATRAYLRPVAADCAPKSDALCQVAGELPPVARFARLVARPLDLVLRLAPVRDLASGALLPPSAAEVVVLQAAVEKVNADGQVQVVIDPQRYDIDVAAQSGVLWFGHKVSIGQVPVGLSWSPEGSPEGSEQLTAILLRVAQAEQVATMLSSVAGAGSLLNPSPVAIDAEVLASRAVDLDPPGQGRNAARECRRALGAVADGTPMPLADVPDLKQCDRLSFAARGEVRGARDVNRIHIDSNFCIHAAYARIEDNAASTALGPPMDMCSDCPDGYSAGKAYPSESGLPRYGV
ncbi:MAG: caspase family protein [Pseudorhodobacter sp.]|nr:caspase family protein [Pseudorhodobacter sp.]